MGCILDVGDIQRVAERVWELKVAILLLWIGVSDEMRFNVEMCGLEPILDVTTEKEEIKSVRDQRQMQDGKQKRRAGKKDKRHAGSIALSYTRPAFISPTTYPPTANTTTTTTTTTIAISQPSSPRLATPPGYAHLCNTHTHTHTHPQAQPDRLRSTCHRISRQDGTLVPGLAAATSSVPSGASSSFDEPFHPMPSYTRGPRSGPGTAQQGGRSGRIIPAIARCCK